MESKLYLRGGIGEETDWYIFIRVTEMFYLRRSYLEAPTTTTTTSELIKLLLFLWELREKCFFEAISFGSNANFSFCVREEKGFDYIVIWWRRKSKTSIPLETRRIVSFVIK